MTMIQLSVKSTQIIKVKANSRLNLLLVRVWSRIKMMEVIMGLRWLRILLSWEEEVRLFSILIQLLKMARKLRSFYFINQFMRPILRLVKFRARQN